MHRTFEWPDSYHRDSYDDLLKFYDRYLKNINNGWEFTPKVRVEVMDAYDYDYVSNRPEREWPVPRTEYKKIYLNAKDHDAAFEPFAEESEVSYDPKTDVTTFDIQFKETTEITGSGWSSGNDFRSRYSHDARISEWTS